MNEEELKKLIDSGETEIIEFKSALNNSFYESISAFANTKGGTILLGVDKRKNIVGVEASDKYLSDLTNRIVNKLSVYPDIETKDIEGKRVFVITIVHSGYPVSYEGRNYERVGNTTREMNSERLKALLLKDKSWDSISDDFSIEEIEGETVERFLRLAVDKKRLSETSLGEPIPIILEKLGLAGDGKLRKGAILLFGKNPQKHFVNLCVRIGRLKGDATIIDDKWVKGNLFQQLEETQNILRQFMSVRYEIREMEREDVWDYPIPALREALLNALIHRDYFDIANFIQIKVYEDRVWFFNRGGLLEGITIEQLKKPHNSYLRNPLIAKVFYLAGYIEQYGSGTVRMVEWMKEAGLPEPEYREEMGGFSVYFYKDIYTEENLEKMGLNERQIRAVRYVKNKGRISNKELQELNEISRQTAARELSGLMKMNILLRHGKTGRDTYYTLIRKTTKNINASQTTQTSRKRPTNDSNNIQSAKDITYKRIKGILEEFVSDRKKSITSGRVMGQIKSAVVHAILSIEDCENIIKQVDVEIHRGRLFPYGPLSKEGMLKRLEGIKNEFKNIKWDENKKRKP